MNILVTGYAGFIGFIYQKVFYKTRDIMLLELIILITIILSQLREDQTFKKNKKK